MADIYPFDTLNVKYFHQQRVLLLFPHMTSPGGAMEYTLRLARLLAEAGAVVGILALKTDTSKFRLPPGVHLFPLNGPLTSSLGYWILFPYWQKKLNLLITSWHPDILVPQVFPANWWGWLYKRLNPGVKLIWICHEPSAFIHSLPWIKALNPWWKSMLARLLRPLLSRIDLALSRNSDSIIANSGSTATALEKVYGAKASCIGYPGIDPDIYSYKPGPKERSLITVARLTSFKRVDFLLEIFQQLLPRFPELTYHIVGTGEEEDRLRLLAIKLGVASRVIFHGVLPTPVLVELYNRSSLFLHGGIDEPFGMAPLESISCGTPVVAHKSGGLTEYVTRDNGILIDSLDLSEWTDGIARYLDCLSAHPEFFLHVHKSVEKFDWRISLLPVLTLLSGYCPEKEPAENHTELQSGAGRKPPMNFTPGISIVMPCFQQVSFLEEAVRSVLDQQNAGVELIVMDPGSTDGSRERLRSLKDEFGERLILVFGPDSGQSDAINRGMAMARGTVLGWLNSDDRFRSNVLSRVADLLETPHPRWLYGQAGIINDEGVETSRFIVGYKNWRGRRFSFSKLLTENFIPQMAVFWNRAIWEAAGGLAIDKHLDMDYDLWLRFAIISKPIVLTESLGDFRIHGSAKGSCQSDEQLEAALATARSHAGALGIKGIIAIQLHRLFSFRTKLLYRLLKPRENS